MHLNRSDGNEGEQRLFAQNKEVKLSGGVTVIFNFAMLLPDFHIYIWTTYGSFVTPITMKSLF